MNYVHGSGFSVHHWQIINILWPCKQFLFLADEEIFCLFKKGGISQPKKNFFGGVGVVGRVYKLCNVT